MKKFLMIFGLLMLVMVEAMGQDSSQESIRWANLSALNGYTVRFRAVNASCYNNGRVEFAICGPGGVPIDQATFQSLRLSDFQITHKGLVLDTTLHRTPVEYTFPWTSVPIESGNFQIGLECVYTYPNWDMVLVTETAQLSVNLEYVEPTIAPLTVTSPDGIILGNIASLDCDSTGRAQIRIEGGLLPYHIVIVNHDDPTDTLRTVTFHSKQHSGTDSTRADYQYYYTFDSMPGGVWDFYLTDSCGYELPRATQMISVVPPPTLDHIGVYASSGDISDSNTVKIRVYMDADYPYYMQMFQPYLQYRFVVPAYGSSPALQGEDELTNPWIDFPNTTSNEFTVIEEIYRANTYCELWDRDLIFQVRLKENGICPPYQVSKTFHYRKPDPRQFIIENEYVVDSVSEAGVCTGITTYRHIDRITIKYSTNEPSHQNPNDDDLIRRYHFTYPIVWEYRDAANIVIKRDTIESSISEKSALQASDFPGRTIPFTETVNMRLVDANGCELYIAPQTIRFEQSVQTSRTPQWRATKEEPICCSELRTINLFEEYSSPGADYDGLTISLVGSPDNLYNFTAVYHASTHDWEVTKDRIDNWAIITTTPDGRSISIADYCMHPGTYTFRITGAPCVEPTTINVWLKGIVNAQIVDEPEFVIVDNCADKYIKFTAGQVAKVNTYRPNGNNNQVLTTITPLTTLFRVVSGPVGGYDEHDTRTYHLGDSIRISVPTDAQNPYIIKIYPDASNSSICGDYAFYDTLHYGGSTVKFDFALALLCNSDDSVGSAYVKAWNGNPPFRYRLYSKPDQEGDLLGDVTLDSSSVAVFGNVHINVDNALSCRVEDACGSAFPFNFYPQTLADLQKTWFDGGLSTLTTCEGSSIQIHALRVGNIFRYEWYENNDTVPFSVSSDPHLFIPRGADTAVYHVKIYQTDCAEVVEDSVTIYPKISPQVIIEPVDDVCPGQEVEVTFTPKAAWGDEVDFTIAFENRQGIETRSYHAFSGETVVDTFYTSTDAKIYHILVQDAECGYPVADPGDTMYVHVSNHIINPCQIITQHDTVCYLEDAFLSAYCTEPASPSSPITIRWYSDFEMTDLLDEDIITTDQGVSYHTLYTLRNQTLRYVSVEKEGWCPSVNNSPNNVVNMTPGGETAVSCTDSYLFFDDGGENGDYHAGQQVSNSSHLFVSQQTGHPLTIHFDSLNLSNTSHLLIFSGSEPRFDALIYELNGYSPNPNIIVSPTDTLMVYFIPGEESASGWSAIVQPSPGIAIGDIYKQNYILYRDTVCQSQTNTYFDRHNFTEGDANLQAELNAAVKISRVYLFERHFKDNNGCDSTVALSLLVTPPAYTQTDTVILSIDTPFIWNGMHCSATGQYAVYSQPYLDNCDSAEYLNLIVLEVDTSTNDVCIGDYTDMGVYVTTPDMKFFRPRPAVGDVLCTDGDILRPDSFLVSGKTPMGVVFYLDPSDPAHQRGKAVALFDAHDTYCTWAPQPATIYQNVHSITQRSTWQEAIADLDGYNNTLEIQRTALNVGGGSFQENAPAGYYCWYYDHMLRGSGPVHKYWYLPAAGEMMLLHSNRATVSKTLNMLADAGLAAPFTDTYGYETMYWTSTEKNNNFSYYVNAKGQLMMHREKYSFWNSTYGYRFVRAIRNFPN